MPVSTVTTFSLSRRSSSCSSKCFASPSPLKVTATFTRCIFPVEILELIVREAYNSDHTFTSIAGFASASYAFRRIALPYILSHVHIGSQKFWADGMPDVRDLSRWVSGVAQALVVPEAVQLRSFRLLRTVHIVFKAETLANIQRIIFPLLYNLPEALTELSLTDLPEISMNMLDSIAQKFRHLHKLELNCAERLDVSCCWDCFEESASCIWHSPIPEVFYSPEDFIMTLRNTLRPLSKLQHLHLGIFLSMEDLMYEHFAHATHLHSQGLIGERPFGPEWCVPCFDRYAEDVRLVELQSTLALAQTLKELRTVTWASFFGRQLQEMDGRKTTIWVFRKDGTLRVRRKPWTPQTTASK
ncbi:uncharacterized protein FOMMEDRAFT_150140 [Fomitiporia mediterranea MF3/22]|uniref:uncharacterized protein n=1 Tax=Fomitiporia mediterranea (strain MF3/22) TaxID=694068 RepID=UPI0004408431|nr:uncharacterized protein FOMMEDRAFT_150140 [Fomitiporia mediterranea MF3/22]EJD07602.1 hypothetical protein FOMMEDRAFT_150140 [Fomitiporia mediterranea MF3/22]